MALGAGFIFLWLLKICFYAVALIIYLIYQNFGTILGIGVIIFIIYIFGRKQNKNPGGTKAVVTPKKTIPPVVHSHSSISHDEYSNDDAFDVDDEEEISDLMENHDLDREEAEHVKDIMDEEGLDEDEAVELKDDL